MEAPEGERENGDSQSHGRTSRRNVTKWEVTIAPGIQLDTRKEGGTDGNGD